MKRIISLLLLAFTLFSFSACSTKKNTSSPSLPSVTLSTEPSEVSSNSPTPSPALPSSNTPSDTTLETSSPLPEPEGDPTTIVLGELRVQLLNERLVRIEEKSGKGFEDRVSLNVVKRQWASVEYSETTTDKSTVITTAHYQVHIPNGAKTVGECSVTDLQGNLLFDSDSKTKSAVFLPSPSDALSSWYFTDSPRIIPSENGYSVSEESAKLNGWSVNATVNDCYIFLPDGSYRDFLADFTVLTGQTEMVNLKMLGFWDSRWYAYTQQTAIKQILDYRDRGYPIDMLVIDTDWRTASSGSGYTINKTYFPKPAAFMNRVHDLGVEIVFNDHPEPVQGTTNLLDYQEILFRNENLKKILGYGMDYWWYDRNWTVSLNTIHDGVSKYATGMYAFHAITDAYYQALADESGAPYARRALIMANVDGLWNGRLDYPSELISHRYSIQWTGDIGSSNEDLADEIYNAVYGSAMLGIPYISADIGGHTHEVTDDMYVRWIQFGALSPIFRVHCTKPYSRMPWLYGDTAESVFHEYVDMRYRLLPVFYNLAHENYTTGLPIVRRLDINYPQYEEASRNDQYLLGDYILVAPLSNDHPVIKDIAFTSNGKEGLLGEYFNNQNLSGSPAYTKYDTDINFDWQKSAPSGLNNDYFSIRWTGEFTVGDLDMSLKFFADDGIRVYIDDQLVADGWSVYDKAFYTESYPAGSTHKIKIEYFDATAYAHIYVTGESDMGVTRTVFIPDGEWVDVWTGASYVGPTTITVEHGLETSPIFVRRSAIIPLADNMEHTDEKDWSHITLDIYPGDLVASATLYEDDTKTEAYKDGQFRTTAFTGTMNKNSYILNIAAAKGTFTGEKYFENRNWSIRVHQGNFGEVTKVVVNGKEVTFEKIAGSDSGHPFANSGAALDGTVYIISFSAPVYEESVVEIVFSSVSEQQKAPEYDRTAVEFEISVTEMSKQNDTIDLTGEGTLDWASYGHPSALDTLYKNSERHLIGEVESYNVPRQMTDGVMLRFSDGDSIQSGSTRNGIYTGRTLEVTLEVIEGKMIYNLYLGGYKSVASVTIRDRAGNVQTLTVGDLTKGYLNRITVTIDAESASEIYIDYSLLSGDNITISAITASKG